MFEKAKVGTPLPKFLNSLILSLLVVSGIEVFNTRDVLAYPCEQDSGALIYDGQGEFNGEQVKVVAYSWAHGYCQKFFTSPYPQVFTSQLGWRKGCEGSYGNCGEMYYYLDDKKVE